MKSSTVNFTAKRLIVALLISGGLLLSGCNGGSGGSGDTLSGTAATGAAITNGSVIAKCRDGSGFKQTVRTSSQGKWTGTLANANALPCALQVSYGTPPQTLHSFATNIGTVNITPLTDLALALATNQVPADWFAGFNGTTLANLNTRTTQLLNSLANKGFAIPSGTPFSTAFNADHSGWDKVLDDLQKAINAPGGVESHAELINVIKDGNLGNLPTAPNAGGGNSSDPNGETVPADSIHSGLVGTYKLIYAANAPGGPFTDGQKVTAVIGSDRSLKISGKTLSNPFYRVLGDPNEAEIIWLDADNQIEYALTDNTRGQFNEINIGDASKPRDHGLPAFLGQLRKDSGDANEDPQNPENPSGDGAALGGNDGATGTLNGVVYTFTRSEASDPPNVGWGAANPERTLGSLTAYKPQGNSFDSLTFWKIVAVPVTPGTYACRTQDGSLPLVRFANGPGQIIDATECTIEIIQATGNTVTGRFSGVFGGHTVTDGYFRVAPSTGGGETLPAGEQGASFKLDGVTYRYPVARDLSYESFAGISATPAGDDRASPGFPVGLQLHTIPNSPGTYACDSHQGNAYRKVNVWFYWNGVWHYAGTRANPAPGPAGSSCSITLTSVGNIIEGRFSGTFKAGDGSSTVIVSDGLFRYIKPAT